MKIQLRTINLWDTYTFWPRGCQLVRNYAVWRLRRWKMISLNMSEVEHLGRQVVSCHSVWISGWLYGLPSPSCFMHQPNVVQLWIPRVTVNRVLWRGGAEVLLVEMILVFWQSQRLLLSSYSYLFACDATASLSYSDPLILSIIK